MFNRLKNWTMICYVYRNNTTGKIAEKYISKYDLIERENSVFGNLVAVFGNLVALVINGMKLKDCIKVIKLIIF